METKAAEPLKRKGGSKYLYEPFQPANDSLPLLRIETIERVQLERWKALDYRLGQIETTLDRVEKRLWLAIFGVAAAVLKEAVLGVLVQ